MENEIKKSNFYKIGLTREIMEQYRLLFSQNLLTRPNASNLLFKDIRMFMIILYFEKEYYIKVQSELVGPNFLDNAQEIVLEDTSDLNAYIDKLVEIEAKTNQDISFRSTVKTNSVGMFDLNPVENILTHEIKITIREKDGTIIILNDKGEIEYEYLDLHVKSISPFIILVHANYGVVVRFKEKDDSKIESIVLNFGRNSITFSN